MDVFWIELSEFQKLSLAEGMESMLRVFLEDDLSEMFYVQECGQWNCVLK